MAIHPVVSSPPAPANPAESAQPTLSDVQPASASPTPVVRLSAPLGDRELDGIEEGEAGVRRRRVAAAAKPPARRDSLRRREALLRGKEGSRRRQRWENNHLVDNPHVAPPTEADWEPRPVYEKKNVPYQYASLWDHPDFPRRAPAKPVEHDHVPRELRARIKKARGALSLLRELEEEVRGFLWCAQDSEDLHDEYHEPVDAHSDSEEEIVFVSKQARVQPETERVLFESLVDDSSASFGRWLVHSIAAYYGLKSWSITSGNPAKRIAYVGMRKNLARETLPAVPKPLYLML